MVQNLENDYLSTTAMVVLGGSWLSFGNRQNNDKFMIPRNVPIVGYTTYEEDTRSTIMG